jgi:hypothetical protein
MFMIGFLPRAEPPSGPPNFVASGVSRERLSVPVSLTIVVPLSLALWSGVAALIWAFV